MHLRRNVYLTFSVFWSLHTVSYFIFPSSLSQTTTFHHISPSQVLFLDLRADLGGKTIIQEESKPRVIGENCWNILRFPNILQVRGEHMLQRLWLMSDGLGWLAGYSDWFIIIMILNIIYQHSALLTKFPLGAGVPTTDINYWHVRPRPRPIVM